MAEFDYLGAKQAGASDEEIQSFLKANGTDFDLIGAKQAGATDDEISTFLKSQPVKKKEVSKPTTQVSSNGTTKTSQSSYNLDLSLPKVNPNPNNKALLGLGQPFKPEIALKSINDERKFINAKTPTQTNFQDYNTVINDGIKGQNKFDNTTQILTSQNVIPQQAKKEVQQLQQKQQVVKDAKKDTRQNILAVIPELADAKNTDEAISTILKSDMKNNLDYWQQFDDEALLGNDENTLNDFLVSNGLKNQDRELYLKEQASSNPKYGYEYEYNKIGSLFKAVKQRADDYDTVLKQKFGDNYMEVAKQGNYDILNDQDFNKFRQLREKQNELSTKANGLINDSRYSEVKSSREKVEKAQQGVDERAKNDKVYKIGDELNYIGNKLAYGAGHVVKMIAELPSLATSIDKGYDFTDRLADWGDRFSNGLIDAIPVSSDIQAGFNNKVANVDGYKVIVDDNGNAVNVTDSKNFKVPTSVFKAVVDKYNTDKTKYSVNNEYNPRSLADNGLNTVIDMGEMILGTKGVGMVGAGEKLQKLTSMGIAYQQTKRDVFNDAIKKGLDPRKADELSNIVGVIAGTSSAVNPMEYNIASGKGIFNFLKTDGLNAGKLALIKEGKLSVKDYAKEFVKEGIKNTGGEWVEELGIENTTQALANNQFNRSISQTDMQDGGLDDNLHIFDKQGLETLLITAGSSFLLTPMEVKAQTQLNQQEALKMAIENPDDFVKIKELQLKQGQISQQQFDNETKIYNDVSKTYNAVKDDVKEELQPQLLALLTKKSNLSNKISEIKDEVLSKPYKDQLEQVNKGIESISVGKNADKRLVAPIEQSEILAESTAKDGSSTISKTETAIANKINKGQELTSEETDYYNAKKDSIDKLVTVNKSPIVPINETVEVEKKEIVLPPPTPQVVAPAELDEQQITEQLNEVLNDKTTPTPLVDTEQEQNISERLPSEYQNNQGVQQINGIGQDVSNESEVPQIEQEQEVVEPISEEVNKDKSVTEKERQDLVKSLNKEQVKEFIKLKTPQERIKFLSDLKNANNKEESKSDKNNEDEQVLQNNISDVLSTKTEEITPKSSIEVDRNVDRIDNSQENIEISSSKKLKTNGSVEEGHSGVFGEDIVDNKGNIVGSKISDTRPNGGKYYQTLVDDTPENRKGFGWQEHQDIDGKIFKKFETLDDLEKFIDSKKEQLKEAPISKTETTENPALKDVESTAKALSELPKETLRDYQYGVDMENFRESLSESDKKDWDELMSLEFDKNANKKRVTELRDKFKPLEQEWFSENDSNPQRIAEQYHENKINGTNPDYVKAVEEALSNKQITNEEQSTNAEKGKKAETVAEISPNKNVSASKASAIKDLIAENYSDLKEMEAGVLANLDGTELVDDLLDYVNWNRATQKGGKFKAKGLKGSAILKLAEKGYIEEPSFTDDNITLTDKGKKFQEALKARQETRKAIKEGTDLFPNDANLQSTDKNFTPISKSKFNELLDKLKKAFPNVKVELFGKSDFDNARKELEKRGIVVTDTKTKDGTIYGFKTPDGKVFINTDNLNANTPIHEFGHIWQSVFPNEFAKGISLLVQSPQGRDLINEIRKNPAYKGKSITEIQAEALVTAIGNKGETIFNSNPTLYNKFKQWLNDLFAKIGDKLGIKNLSPDDKFDMFTKKVVGELLGGKVLSKDVGKNTSKTITFQGENIKVKEINGGAEVVNGFYSPLEKIIGETKFDKLPVKQWVEKFGKGEEAKWTGLTDWLGQQQGSVSKKDIQNYLKDNRIEIVEVVKGGEQKVHFNIKAEKGKSVVYKNGVKDKEFDTYDKADDYVTNYKESEVDATKFSQHQLEGEKENYKEVLVTMPNKIKSVQFWKLADGERRNSNGDLISVKINGDWIDKNDAKVKYGIDYDTINNESEYKFKSSHFDEPNILVHLRMNTRTDAEGNKVLFLEEVQSDWGQEGKKKGFEEDTTKLKSEYDKIHKRLDELQDLFDNGKKTKELSKEFSELYDQRAKLERDINDLELGKTPTAPFVTDTNAWTKLGLKVALKEAVKQGADKIAWSTGTQQFDRWGSEEISWRKNTARTPQEETRMKELGEKIVNYKDTDEERVEHEKLARKEGGFSLLINEQTSGAIAFNGQESGNKDDVTIQSKEDLRKAIKKNLARKRNEAEIDKLTDRIWNRMQTEDSGTSLPRKEGMEGFYGVPSENKLGIVGNVAKSLFKQEPKTTEIIGEKVENYTVSDKIKSLERKLNNIESGNNIPTELKEKASNKLTELQRAVIYDGLSKQDAAKQYKEYLDEIGINKFNEDTQSIKDEIKSLKEKIKPTTSTQHSIDITPEMKAMVEFGQPLFQFKPDELTKKVQELRDYELTDNEIRDYLLEAGNTKQQIDDALGVKEVGENKDETKKELSDSKQRVAERIVLGNSTLNAVKEHIVQQGYDKSDYDSKQIFKDIDELINKFGIEKAESFIDKIGDVGLSEPHKVVLQHKIAEYYGNKALSDETLTEEERKEAMFKSAQLFLDLSQQRTDAGRGNAILAQIYLESDIYFTLPMFENKMNAIGAQLSGAEKIELENLQNEIKELRKENIKLQELAKKEAEQQIVDDITTHLLVDDLIIDSKIKDDLEVKNAKSILAKGFEDIARMLSSIAMAQQVDKVKFKDTILDMTKATMTISKIGVKKALKSVIKAIKNANQNIDEKLLEDAEKHVLSQIKETDTGIKKKNKESISKDELIELIEQGADTMEKMVEAIRNKYYDGDKSISDKQIRDEITNYGNSIRQSQTQVEEKLSEIKSLMLLQSKLEDAENNVAPKKTGFIRDKDKIAVREKRRELAEAMKKLTVTLSEDDIAGLNERKLTQISNKIEEVQKVLDGYEKIKNKANFDYNDAVKKKQQELDDLMSSQKALLHYAKENLTNLVAKYQDKLDKKQYSKNPTLNKLSITDSEYQKLKNQLEAKKEQLKSERDNFRNNNADYLLENRQKQIDRQIVELDNLLAGIKVRKTSEQIKAEKDRKAGVINSSTNQSALDKLKENQNQLEAKKEQWERKIIQKEVEIEKAKQTWLQKLGINAMSISRTLTLGLTDIGWLTVQGGYFGRTKPHLFAKALKESFKGKLSEEAFNQWKRDLKSNPFYETMIKAGLRIPSQSLRDDIFEQEFRESGFTKLLGKNEVTDIVNKNGRLSVKFLANLRIQVFQKMYNGLTDSQKADKEVLEKLADYVNSRSGAGQVIGEDNKRGLNKWWGLLTSARNTSAMLQQTYIGMLYGLAKNYVRNKPLSNQPIIARQLVNDLLNQAVLFSGLYLSYLIANGLSGDDDEWNVETSPFSTNFLKLKNKEGDRSYFDMGGMTALNVATLRLLTTITNAFGTDINNLKDYEGKYSKVGLKDYSSKTGLQILSESIFNRTLSLLAPIKNPFTAKSDKDGNYSMYGKTYTPTEFKVKMLMDMFIPMNLPNIYNDITDKDVNALGAIANTILSVIGISNQNQKYDKPEDSTSPQVNSVPVKSTPVSSMPIVPRPVK